jgi:hydrogenase expression/formation protein HypE
VKEVCLAYLPDLAVGDYTIVHVGFAISRVDEESAHRTLPLRDYPTIVLGHGGGGKLSNELIEHIFVPAFRNTTLEMMGDSSVLSPPTGRLAFSTDSYVVQPLFFPGGCIGDLAVHGTVNDLSMSGAKPLYLSAGFILEEGFPISHLAAIVDRMARAAREAGVQIVTGDTKVVEKGHGDGCYINTSGIGVIADGIQIDPTRACPGDVVIVSGTLGDHGMAIMSVREGLEFETIIKSDTAALNAMVASLLQFAPHLHVLRDPTRGGLASSLNEIALKSDVGILIDERSLPILPDVQSACDLLGMDPVYVPNEGKLVAIVDSLVADDVLACIREDKHGQNAAIIGKVTSQHKGMLAAKTMIGGTRIIPLQIGEQIPRIC